MVGFLHVGQIKVFERLVSVSLLIYQFKFILNYSKHNI